VFYIYVFINFYSLFYVFFKDFARPFFESTLRSSVATVSHAVDKDSVVEFAQIHFAFQDRSDHHGIQQDAILGFGIVSNWCAMQQIMERTSGIFRNLQVMANASPCALQ
jgi:hypothetical protein